MTLVTLGSVSGMGFLAFPLQSALSQSQTGVSAAELTQDAIAHTYVRRNGRSGSGRRGMRG
ncbi:MAG: hypothetical protein AAFW95_10330 [Cyanobacteria bacterium J06638_6]